MVSLPSFIYFHLLLLGPLVSILGGNFALTFFTILSVQLKASFSPILLITCASMKYLNYTKHVCFNAAFRRKLLNRKRTKKTQCRKSNQWCNFLLLARISSKKKASFAFWNTFYDSAFAKNKRAAVQAPHFFLSFCFFSGFLPCSVVMLRGMRSTLPSGPYCSEYSLAE